MRLRCGSGTFASTIRAFPMACWGGRYIHYDLKGRIRAFEFVAVSRGVNLEDFPEPEAALGR